MIKFIFKYVLISLALSMAWFYFSPQTKLMTERLAQSDIPLLDNIDLTLRAYSGESIDIPKAIEDNCIYCTKNFGGEVESITDKIEIQANKVIDDQTDTFSRFKDLLDKQRAVLESHKSQDK